MTPARRLGLVMVATLGTLALDAGAVLGQRPGIGKLGVVLGSTSIVFPDPGIEDFDAGGIDHPGILVSVQARPKRKAWELRIRSDDPGLGGYGKPLSDLVWRVDGSTVWSPISATDQTVAQGVGDEDITLYLRLRLDWTADPPDDYATSVVLTVLEL